MSCAVQRCAAARARAALDSMVSFLQSTSSTACTAPLKQGGSLDVEDRQAVIFASSQEQAARAGQQTRKAPDNKGAPGETEPQRGAGANSRECSYFSLHPPASQSS